MCRWQQRCDPTKRATLHLGGSSKPSRVHDASFRVHVAYIVAGSIRVKCSHAQPVGARDEHGTGAVRAASNYLRTV